jgi:RNA polymerase sigma-70 factor (sigma-E family)
MARPVWEQASPAPAPRRGRQLAAVDEEPTRDEAVDLLFRRHYPDLLRLAYCLLGERSQAEDAVQDAFVSLYSHWNGLRDPAAAPDYLRSAVINRCRSRVRALVRERKGRRLQVVVDPTQASSEDAAVTRAEGSRLARVVQRLPRRQREVVVCRYYLELSVAETAELLEITVGSVKRHAHRAIETLGDRLEVTP